MIITSNRNDSLIQNHTKMKQVITLIIGIVVTLTTFASGKPANSLIKAETIRAAIKTANTLNISLKSTGKVSLSWAADAESTTTFYNIEKSVNGGAFKTVALLMGENNDKYTYSDNVKEVTGNILYRVVLIDRNTVVKTLTQTVVIF
jgi:hypothetical protein